VTENSVTNRKTSR